MSIFWDPVIQYSRLQYLPSVWGILYVHHVYSQIITAVMHSSCICVCLLSSQGYHVLRYALTLLPLPPVVLYSEQRSSLSYFNTISLHSWCAYLHIYIIDVTHPLFPRFAEYWKILLKQKNELTKQSKTVPYLLFLSHWTRTFCRKIFALKKWLFNGLFKYFSLENLLWRETINLTWHAFIIKIHSGFGYIIRKTTQ